MTLNFSAFLVSSVPPCRRKGKKNNFKTQSCGDQFTAPYPGSVKVIASCENDPQSQESSVEEEEHKELVVGVADTVVHPGS